MAEVMDIIGDLTAVECASVMKQWLLNLPTNALPEFLHSLLIQVMEVIDPAQQIEDLKTVLMVVPVPHLMMLRTLFLHLKKVMIAEANGMGLAELAKFLQPVIARSQLPFPKRKQNMRKVIEMMITNASHVGVVPDWLQLQLAEPVEQPEPLRSVSVDEPNAQQQQRSRTSNLRRSQSVDGTSSSKRVKFAEMARCLEFKRMEDE